MSEHESCTGASDDWYTPPAFFEAFGITFDLDPCSPGPGHWVPARKIYTKADDGLARPWDGTVFMNPPFGGRNGQVPWLTKFLNHGDGIAIVAARTSAAWFHSHAIRADTMLFPRGKTKFIRPDGSTGGSPGTGVVLIGMGDLCNEALEGCGLGWFVDQRHRLVEPTAEEMCLGMSIRRGSEVIPLSDFFVTDSELDPKSC